MMNEVKDYKSIIALNNPEQYGHNMRELKEVERVFQQKQCNFLASLFHYYITHPTQLLVESFL